MKTRGDIPLSVPWPLLIHPALITLWTTFFSLWFLIDSQGAFAAFDIATNAEPFILQTSASRYVALAVALWLGVWILRTPETMFVALLARFSMDVLDTVAGLRTGLLEPTVTGFAQPLLMFLAPALVTLVWLGRRIRRPT